MTPQERLERFEETTITAPIETLPTTEKETLKALIKAAKVMDKIFLKQSYSKNEELLAQLKEKDDKILLELYIQHAGPFDRVLHNEAFIKGHEKPLGAGFYPEDLNKEEWNKWLQTHPQDREAFENPYTIITRTPRGLQATPYHTTYKEEVEEAAKHLKEAAEKTSQEPLRNYLQLRAKALLNDDYQESEIAWINLQSDIDMTIGPYEVYEDELNGIKTAYEAFIGLKDKEETKLLKKIEAIVGELEETLPIAEEHKNTHRGKLSPLLVVNEIYCAGDGKAGVQFTAFNLPNDEEVREIAGSKKVMIKNVAQAKYDECWIPITAKLFNKETQEHFNFEAYFTHILLHEISHGLGPGKISVQRSGTKNREQGTENRDTGNREQKTGTQKGGKWAEEEKQGIEQEKHNAEHATLTVNAALKETYSAIEEAKADLLGVYNAHVLVQKGILEKKLAEDITYTYIGGIFRSIRFGIGEAHGAANIMAYNKLLEKGGVEEREGKVHIDYEKAKKTLNEFIKEILHIQATGNYEKAKQLLEKYRKIERKTRELLENIKNVPIDIKPIFATAEELLGEEREEA